MKRITAYLLASLLLTVIEAHAQMDQMPAHCKEMMKNGAPMSDEMMKQCPGMMKGDMKGMDMKGMDMKMPPAEGAHQSHP